MMKKAERDYLESVVDQWRSDAYAGSRQYSDQVGQFFRLFFPLALSKTGGKNKRNAEGEKL